MVIWQTFLHLLVRVRVVRPLSFIKTTKEDYVSRQRARLTLCDNCLERGAHVQRCKPPLTVIRSTVSGLTPREGDCSISVCLSCLVETVFDVVKSDVLILPQNKLSSACLAWVYCQELFNTIAFFNRDKPPQRLHSCTVTSTLSQWSCMCNGL